MSLKGQIINKVIIPPGHLLFAITPYEMIARGANELQPGGLGGGRGYDLRGR